MMILDLEIPNIDRLLLYQPTKQDLLLCCGVKLKTLLCLTLIVKHCLISPREDLTTFTSTERSSSFCQTTALMVPTILFVF